MTPITLPDYISSETAALIMAITVVLSLIAYLKTNLSPGGMIVPGVLVLTALEGLPSMITTLTATVTVWLIVKALHRWTILYGKRLFVTNLIVSTVLVTTGFFFFHRGYPQFFPNDTLGLLAPGLISYQLFRQKVLPTIISTSIVTGAGLIVAGVALGV
jgi:gamma-polyglutamate biosynthesis protein CapC